MDLRRADLHTHTHCSDGRLAPAELVRSARQHGLQALAITDHDTIDGLAEGMAAGRRWGVEVVPGVELSVTVGETEVHLLGYFFDPDDARLRAHLTAFREARFDRARWMVHQLNGLGFALDLDDVLAQARGGAVGRPHVAQAMAASGYVATYQEAFDQYLRDGAPAFVSKPLFPAEEALEMLHRAGGIGVLAHPGHWTSDAVVRALVAAGLDGFEVIHPAHDLMLTRYYRQLARDHGLSETGGSDYHGVRPSDEEHFGPYSIPYPQFERLRARARGNGRMTKVE
jgi:predicted metal-dependent phosphoesterase TrpH